MKRSAKETPSTRASADILLGQLRHSEGAGPQPVLADLDRLLAQLRHDAYHDSLTNLRNRLGFRETAAKVACRWQILALVPSLCTTAGEGRLAPPVASGSTSPAPSPLPWRPTMGSLW